MTERSMYQRLAQSDLFPVADLVESMVGIWLRSVYGS
jgi:hypothetical protein